MRTQIVRVALRASCVAILVFVLPLAVIIRLTIIDEERRELERAALVAAVSAGPSLPGDAAATLRAVGSGSNGDPGDPVVGVYDATLRLKAGRGPIEGDGPVTQAVSGRVADGTSAGQLIVAVPIESGSRLVGVVRAALPVSSIWSRVALAWLILAAVAAAATAGAVLAARRFAQRLSRPLENLAAASQRIADGDLSVRAESSSIAEIDLLARAQNAMVDALAGMLHRARRFGVETSHQLRTPLTGLQLGLDAAARHPYLDGNAELSSLVSEAAHQSRDLQRIVSDLLVLAQHPPAQWRVGETVVLDSLVADVARRWHGRLAADGRQLKVLAVTAGRSPASRPACNQILDVLIDNAHRHGRGAVSLGVRELGGAVAIDVADEGMMNPQAEPFHPREQRTAGAIATSDTKPTDTAGRSLAGTTGSHTRRGLGLQLARSLAEACGGRIYLRNTQPTTFTLIVPSTAEGTHQSRPSSTTSPVRT